MALVDQSAIAAALMGLAGSASANTTVQRIEFAVSGLLSLSAHRDEPLFLGLGIEMGLGLQLSAFSGAPHALQPLKGALVLQIQGQKLFSSPRGSAALRLSTGNVGLGAGVAQENGDSTHATTSFLFGEIILGRIVGGGLSLRLGWPLRKGGYNQEFALTMTFPVIQFNGK